MRNIFFNRQSSKLGLLGSLVAVVAVAIALVLIPQKTNIKTLAENCQNPPTTPTLNYWPVTYSDGNTPLCHDFPAIDAAVYNQGSPSVFSQNEADWNNGLNLNVGQRGVALMYVHNGAANNLPANQTTARNVKVTATTATSTGTTHTITANFAGDNTNTVNKSFTIHTPANTRLEVESNSGALYNYTGQITQQGFSLGNGEAHNLGDLQACFEYSVFLSFRFKVVADTPVTPTLSITKQVRSLDRNTSFASSVSVDRNERVQYKAVVKNNGPVTATGVTFTDNGVNGVQIESNSVTIDGVPAQRSLPGTIPLGDMAAGSEKTIVFNARAGSVDGSFVNTATAVATNAASVSATATVIVTHTDPPNPNMAVEKLVKNLTTGGSYANIVSAKANERVAFKVTVTNTGNTALNNVVITDPIPAGLQFDDSVSTTGNVSFNNNTLTVNFGTVPAGQSRTVEFAAKVTRTTAGSVCNVATASSSNTGSVMDSACVNVVEVPVETRTLAITKLVKNNNQGTSYADSVGAKTGEWVNFKVTATNTGNATINNFKITDSIPSGLELDRNSIVTNGNVSISGSTITVNFGSVAAGQSRVLEFATKVVRNTAGTVCNVGTASGDGANSVNADACVTVTPPPVETRTLSITKLVKNNNNNTSYADTVGAKTGEWVSFKVTATNTGNATINNFKITDPIPSGLELDGASIVTTGNVSMSGSTITVNFGSVTAGQSRTVEFAAKVIRATVGTICNIGTASGDGASSVNEDACVNVTVPPVETRALQVTKLVKSDTSGSTYTKSATVKTGDRVFFKVTVANVGNVAINNVKITDQIPSGLTFDNSVATSGNPSFNNNTLTVTFGTVPAGQSRTVEFAAKVAQTIAGQICNTGWGSGDDVKSADDNACVTVTVTPGTPNIVQAKTAFNNTKNADAVSVKADRGNTITFTLKTTNNGTADSVNYIITDDLSGVLPLADLVDLGGATLEGNILTFPAVTIKPGETITKTFQVKVKTSLAANLSYQIKNTYGNTVVIDIPGQQVFEAPKTGAAGLSAGIFAGLLTAGFAVVRRRKDIMNFIFA